MFEKSVFRFLVVVVSMLMATDTQAVTIDLMPVGNPGNPADTNGFGSVAEPYLIGKYEVTNAQWREFLTVKASVSDPYGLYDTRMADENDGGISRSGSGTASDPWVYSNKDGGANWKNRPVNYVSFWNVARFCNWLHNGQGDGDTETGAYANIGEDEAFVRQPGAKYFIPTADEWYKAAFHKNDGVTDNYWNYATGTKYDIPSNDLIDPDPGNNANFYQYGYTLDGPYGTTEVGEFEYSESPYGTFDQAGNLWEWNETAYGSKRPVRGGSWQHSSTYLSADWYTVNVPDKGYGLYGFRVASAIPEPSTAVLLPMAAFGLLFVRRRQSTP